MRRNTSASQAWGSTTVEFGRGDQGIDRGHALAAAIGTGEEPGAAPEIPVPSLTAPENGDYSAFAELLRLSPDH